jgi:hypothetical protein
MYPLKFSFYGKLYISLKMHREMKETCFVVFFTMLVIYNLPRDGVPVEKIV